MPVEAASGARVLFTGQYWPGANSLYIARAFERNGAIVRMLNDSALYPDWRLPVSKAARRLLKHAIEAEWNRQLLDLVNRFQPDLVYITNADLCRPQTVQAIREMSIPVMCFYHDVQWKNRAGTRFEENLAIFDLVATTRRWHEPEFRAAGAKAVGVVRFGYEPSVHRPLDLPPRAMARYGSEVTFIGTYEPHRAAELSLLAKTGLPRDFRLWGGYWNRLAANSPLLPYWQGREVQEGEVPAIYAGSAIALHWVGWEPNGADEALRKGDQHNSRTFQIAACGGAMMLAQRTDEHLKFFVEDEEAVYFDDVRELREKLGYWLDPARDVRRRAIALAARARCLREDYTYVPVARTFLEFFGLGGHERSQEDGESNKTLAGKRVGANYAARGNGRTNGDGWNLVTE